MRFSQLSLLIPVVAAIPSMGYGSGEVISHKARQMIPYKYDPAEPFADVKLANRICVAIGNLWRGGGLIPDDGVLQTWFETCDRLWPPNGQNPLFPPSWETGHYDHNGW